MARYTKNELLLESLLQATGENRGRNLERYEKKGRSIKNKVLFTKILYAVIFGLLPIMPLLTYFQIIENLPASPVLMEGIILFGSILFILYFTLQFFNFFLMGLLESGVIMSGIFFRWFETLPISRDKLHKLAYLTIFRSFDIPMIVIVLGFPITILIGTQNILFFFVSLGISILNMIFSFNLLIIFGEKLNRVLDFNQGSSKKSHRIRLFHILSYLLVILGSIYTVQWAFSSLETIFQLIMDLEDPAMINIVLSMIPYPFNLSYLFSNIITLNRGYFHSWFNIFIGLGLFILLTLWSHLKASETLRKITYAKLRKIKKEKRSKLEGNEIPIKIKTHSPTKAYLRKDLSAGTHDLNTLLSMIMPIILSCVFSFSLNIINIGSSALLQRDLLFSWIGTLLFTPIISSMLVFGILNIETSGKSITASLPINPREQANAKLILLLVLQTIAVLAPLLIYIGTDKFLITFVATLFSLPIALSFLILTFELKVLFFSKYKDYYLIEETHSENRIYKWVLITCFQYILSFWIMSFLINFFNASQLLNLVIFFSTVSIISFPIVIFLFYKIFPVLPAFKTIPIIRPKHKFELEAEPTIFSKHSWLSIFTLMILYWSFLYLIGILFDFLFQDYWFFQSWDPNSFFTSIPFEISKLFLILCSILIFILIFILGVPKVLGLPYGKLSIKQYLESIKAKWVENVSKYIIGGLTAILLLYLGFASIGLSLFSIEFQLFMSILTIIQIFWQELIFRGLILPILLKNRGNKKSLILNALIFTIFNIISLFSTGFPPPSYIIISVAFVSFGIGVLLAYICIKTNSVLPGIFGQLMLYLALPLYFFFLTFPVIIYLI